MDKLALTITPSPLETPTSFISRLAARNYCDDIKAFCYDVGIELGNVSYGYRDAIKYVCHLASIPENSFDNTTIHKTSTIRYVLGDEVLDTKTLNRGEVRLCPQCISAELQKYNQPWEVIHQLHWQIPQIERCTLHGCGLIILGEKNNTAARFDVTASIRDHREMITQKAQQIPETVHSADAFDIYLSKRIYGSKDGSWCDGLNIPTLWRCALALGITLLHGKRERGSGLSVLETRAATLHGFGVLHAGENATKVALANYLEKDIGKRDNQPAPQYGQIQRMFRQFSHKLDFQDDFGPMRELLYNHIIEHHPIKAGDKILGKILDRRRVHSMHSAYRELKIRRDILEEILIERNIGFRDFDGRFVFSVPLTVEVVEELKSQKERFILKTDVGQFIGATEVIVKELYKSGVLISRHGHGRWERKVTDTQDLIEFIAKLFEETKKFRKAPQGTTILTQVTRTANCNVSDAIKLIQTGKLKPVGRIGNALKLSKLLLNNEDLIAAFPPQIPNGITKTECMKIICAPTSTLNHLIEIGLLKTKRMKSNTTRRTNHLIVPESMASFKRGYFTLGMLRKSHADFAKYRVVDLNKLNLTPIVNDKRFRRVYRWEDFYETLRKASMCIEE